MLGKQANRACPCARLLAPGISIAGARGVRRRATTPAEKQQQDALLGRAPALPPQQTDTFLDSLEVQVPFDQRPVNELAALKKAWLYSWACLEPREYLSRLAGVFAFFALVFGAPISNVTFDPLQQPAEFVLSTVTGALVVVVALVVRIYGGWSYVADRLMSASIPYEETGWYDGQVYAKPVEVLTRDRLLGAYEVRPTLSKLRSTLVGSGVALLACSVVLAVLIRAGTDADGMYGRSATQALSPTSSPDYCGDRYYQALAEPAHGVAQLGAYSVAQPP